VTPRSSLLAARGTSRRFGKTAALDPPQRRRLWERTAALREAGGAFVFATQNLDEVERVADRVAALRDGRLVFAGPVDEYDRSETESLFA
jgi:ABC-type multidrug transport system ATPase subunit